MNRHILLYATMLSVPVLLAAATHKPAVDPVLTTEPLSADRVAIYRDFMTTYVADPANGAGTKLNVVVETEAFTPSDNMDPDKPCLWADDIDNLNTPHLHRFSVDAFPSNRVHLVDLTEPPPPPHVAHTISVPMPFVHRKQAAAAAPAPPPPAPEARPATLFTLSEIVFNKRHNLAAFHFSYTCGDQCGHGATILYELHEGKWHPSKRGCSKWVI